MRGLTIRRTIKVDFDADRWQLFDEKGRDEAAQELNRALEAAVNADGATEASAYKAMEAVCAKHGQLGAQDGEADGLIETVLDKVFGED